ncbi:hypothetical protein [Lactiplantibacillus plantarum]|nr:hypothetical protein [Lactiplantibacillus plantarum]
MQTIFQIIVTVAALVVIVYAVQQHSPTSLTKPPSNRQALPIRTTRI